MMKLSVAKTSQPKPAASTSVDSKLLPRVSVALTLTDLKEECKARGLKGYSNYKKDMLLETLRVGSICISQMREYKIVEEVKEIMKKEDKEAEETKRKQREQSMVSATTSTKVPSTNSPGLVHVLHFPCALSESSKLTVTKNNISAPRPAVANCNICRENGSKFCCLLHDWDICDKCATIDYTVPTIELLNIHHHKLVESGKVLNPQKTALRSASTFCDLCKTKGLGKYSCLSCNWDICSSCVYRYSPKNTAVMSGSYHPRDRTASDENDPPPKRTKMTASKGDGRSHPRTTEQREVSIHTAAIKKPDKDINQNPRQLLKYVVWSSAGYPPDGWHSYEGEPKKEFDSSWNTIVEANKRANYVFFYKNIWGLSRDEIEDKDFQQYFDDKGFVNYYVHPDDSEEYTVKVVTKEVFEYLLRSQKDKYRSYGDYYEDEDDEENDDDHDEDDDDEIYNL